jgi:hypothetical protein
MGELAEILEKWHLAHVFVTVDVNYINLSRNSC